MARPRKRTALPALTSGQASFVVERLIQDRRLSAREVSEYLAELAAEIRDLEARIAILRNAAGTPAEMPRAQGGPRGQRRRLARRQGRVASRSKVPPLLARGSSPVRRRRRVTLAQRAARQLQGRYVGYLRQVPTARRALYQRIYAERGVDAAIAALRADLRK